MSEVTLKSLDKKIDINFVTLDKKIDSKVDALGKKIDIKVDALDKKIDILDKKIEDRFNKRAKQVDKRFAGIEMKLFEHDKRFDILEERTKLIPKLYDSVDKILTEVIGYRQERAFMSNTIHDHENRILRLEGKVPA